MVGRFADDTEQSVSQAVASDCAAIRSLQTKDSSETSVIFSFSFLFFLFFSLFLSKVSERSERKEGKQAEKTRSNRRDEHSVYAKSNI